VAFKLIRIVGLTPQQLRELEEKAVFYVIRNGKRYLALRGRDN